MRELHLKSGKIIEFDCSVYKHVTFDDLHVCLLSGEIKRTEKRTLIDLNEEGEVL